MDLVRRLVPVLFALGLLLAAGCSSLFDDSYSSREPYQAPSAQEEAAETEEEEPAYDNITNFAALRRAVLQLVTDHVESAQLQFTNYDGSISQDISTACWEVKSSTALGAFAVDYISYDLSRIVSYYQAEVNITYKRSAAQVDALERAPSVSALTARLDRALRDGDTYLVLEIADASATADTVRAYVSEAYYADPLACPVLPEVEVGLFPETGVSRIAEMTLNYGLEPSELHQRRSALDEALASLTGGLLPGPSPAPETASPAGTPAVPSSPEPSRDPRAEALDQADRLKTLCARLADRCVLDERAGSTAWDALAGGAADSEGLALALKAGCQAVGLDCLVVAGRVDGEEHYWNMVTLAGDSYHVDVSGTSGGTPAVFLSGDEQLWGVYWWDTSEYPPCPEDFRSAAEPVPSPGPSPAPSPSGAPLPMTL